MRVLLIDRAPAGEAGASFGNAGHIATELLEPLPSPTLLFGFWRELFAFGGVLDIPARRLAAFMPWAARFARAAFQRAENTRHLAPFVRPAVPALIGMLGEIGRVRETPLARKIIGRRAGDPFQRRDLLLDHRGIAHG